MFKKIGLLFVLVCILAVIIMGSFLWSAYLIQPDASTAPVEVVIVQGSSVKSITSLLAEKEIIKNEFLFKVFVRTQGSGTKLQSGTFHLRQHTNFASVVETLSSAENTDVQVTIPEGFTEKQIQESVAKVLVDLDQNAWSQLSKGNARSTLVVQDILTSIPSGQGLEGYLFPDTYRFSKDADAKTVIETMLFTLKRRFAEKSEPIPNSLVFENKMTLHELLTLASIVEREVRNADDMKVVAGIFFTRLKIGMALQADSTINYVTGGTTPSVSLKDTKIDSAYNTYRHLGLPPGPISNPGMNAILAVLHPVDTNYVYFLTTPDGRVVYSKTFDEHIANKQKYLR